MRLSIFIMIFLLVSACTTVDMAPEKPAMTALPGLDNPWYDAAQADLAQSLSDVGQPDDARNVILFIGDGMSIATITAARILEGQLRGGTGEENRLAFERFPHVALAKTYNTNAQVPDSAGTATAMLSGIKTQIGVVGVSADIVRGDCSSVAASTVPSLLELAEQRGLATGVITTTRITHATPASAYAHVADRAWEAVTTGDCPDIARQLIEFSHGDGPEVVLGGGRAAFTPGTTTDPEYTSQTGWRTDGRDLIGEWTERHGDTGRYVWNNKQFDAVNIRDTSKLLGLFEPSHMQYQADRNDGPGGEPSLSEMVKTGIRMLDKSGGGYFLLVEAGRIDHAHHSANAYRALHDAIALSDAVATARKMTDSDDTLIIVTADHGHVLAMAGYPTRGNPILGKVISLNLDGSPAASYALDASGKPYTTLVYGNGPGYVGTSDSQAAGPKTYPHFPVTYEAAAVSRPNLSDIDTEHPDYLQESAVPTDSETHSGTDVAVYADGPGARLLHGVHEQNYIFHVMAHALFANRR